MNGEKVISYLLGSDTGIIITIIILSIVVILVLIKIYTYLMARNLRHLGYEFVYFYIKRCASKGYYRTPEAHISTVYGKSYDKLVKNRNKWYLRTFTKNKIESLISFFEKSSSLTEDISPFFSLDHYFTHSEHLPFLLRATSVEKAASQVADKACKEYINFSNR